MSCKCYRQVCLTMPVLPFIKPSITYRLLPGVAAWQHRFKLVCDRNNSSILTRQTVSSPETWPISSSLEQSLTSIIRQGDEVVARVNCVPRQVMVIDNLSKILIIINRMCKLCKGHSDPRHTFGENREIGCRAKSPRIPVEADYP